MPLVAMFLFLGTIPVVAHQFSRRPPYKRRASLLENHYTIRLSECKMDKKIVLLVLLGVIVASSDALFFGVPRSTCTYDNQCRLGKCVNRGNVFCGIGSKFLTACRKSRVIIYY